MSIAGNLRTMGFADLLQWLSASDKTGVLVLDGSRYTKKIFFRRGSVVAVSSDNPREMLGYYLVGWGYCTEDDLHYIIEMQDHFKVMLGELAVKLGHLDKEELHQLLLIKTEETIYDLILWEEGNFRFLEGELPERDFLEVELPVSSFLFEGFRQRDERIRMRDLIPDAHHIPVLVAAPTDVNEIENNILAYVDGQRSIEQVALECRVPEFDVLSFVYRCAKQNILQVLPPGDEELSVPGQSDAPWLEAARDVEDRLRRGRLLDALKLLNSLEERYADHPDATRTVEGLKGHLATILEDDKVVPEAILEPTAGVAELVNLDCDPAEGFVLSRINGYYSVQEVLSQLPGSQLHNRVIVHNLLRRGLIKVRAATAVRRYRRSDVAADVHQIANDLDEPFRD